MYGKLRYEVFQLAAGVVLQYEAPLCPISPAAGVIGRPLFGTLLSSFRIDSAFLRCHFYVAFLTLSSVRRPPPPSPPPRHVPLAYFLSNPVALVVSDRRTLHGAPTKKGLEDVRAERGF